MMEHGHPVKTEQPEVYVTSQVDKIADPAPVRDTIPAHIANLPYVQLLPTNDSEILVNSGWLLLTNVASTYKQDFDPVDTVDLTKLVVLRYIGEGNKSRLFLVKDGVDEKLLKLYHEAPADTAEAEAYDLLNKSYSDKDTDKNISPKYEGSNITVFETKGVQIRAYVTLMEYIRSESLCDVSRKVHKDTMDVFEKQLTVIIRALHEKGIAHGNIAASNILIDDSTRYQASLEFKPLAKDYCRVRLVGFSSAKFQEKMDSSTWKLACREDRSKVKAVCALINSQHETNHCIRSVKRTCVDDHHDQLRQRALVRTLPQADPNDNELYTGLLGLANARLPLVLAVAEHFEKGGKDKTALQWLERHKDNSSQGKPEDYVSVHLAIAKTLHRLNESTEKVEEAWDQAIDYSRECTGLASRNTMNVRRSHAMWLLESGQKRQSAQNITAILQDMMKYYRRGTGAEMTDDETFMKDISAWIAEIRLRQQKTGGALVIPASKYLTKLFEAMEAYETFSKEIEAAREKKRKKQEELKLEKMATQAAQNTPDPRGSGEASHRETPAKRPASHQHSADATSAKKPRVKTKAGKKAPRAVV